MTKLIYSIAIISMLSLSVSPLAAQEVAEFNGCQLCPPNHLDCDLCEEEPIDTTTEVGTGFTRIEGTGAAPVVKVKWEMLPRDEWNDTCDDCGQVEAKKVRADDSCKPGAQFDPPGEWGAMKKIYVCAIAMDEDGLSDINAVYSDIFYPEKIALGPGHEDVGCGEQHGYEIQLHRLELEQGYNLFCDDIYNYNYNLPKFNPDYDYEDICAEDGQLLKQTAAVYCKYTELKWEDPAGGYKVQVHAVDNYGKDSEPLYNHFYYRPLTAFETDFTSVPYGNVKLNTPKKIPGDLTWNADKTGPASVRNVGNTRLRMTVWQDDMGLGKTVNGSEWWNVKYDARVGSYAEYAIYDPYQTTVLDVPLELSQMNEMDFSIRISKFPLGTGDNGVYSGQMVLGAVRAPFLQCCGIGAKCED
jgi:hypothetical protein